MSPQAAQYLDAQASIAALADSEAAPKAKSADSATSLHQPPPSSPLDERLTPAQRSSVYQWLDDREESLSTAVKRIFSEFALKVSKQQLTAWYQQRKLARAGMNLREQAEAAREILLAGSDADTVEEAVVTMLLNRAMEVVTTPHIKPAHYREIVGLVVRLREQNISLERLKLERARFELDVADLVLKHLDKLKASGALQVEDRGEAARKIREVMFGQYTKEQLEAAALAVS